VRRPAEITSLVAGFAIAAVGVLVLLDDGDVIRLDFAYLAPAVLATVGAILVASGLSRSRRDL
jgi:uncharacterized membrane protein